MHDAPIPSGRPQTRNTIGGPVGFWFINSQPDPELIARQLDEFVKQGFIGVVLHPRDGLTLPYPSTAWFQFLARLIDACTQRNLQPWFYDENPFPTGTAGGALLNHHPHLVGQTLAFTQHPAHLRHGSLHADLHGQGRLLRAFLLPQQTAEQAHDPVDVTEYAGLIADDWHVQGRRNHGYGPSFADTACQPHIRAWMNRDRWVVQCPAPSDQPQQIIAVWLVDAQTSRSRGYIDLLNPETTQRFIEITHEATLRVVGEKRFDQCVCSFTDEPHLASPFPWTGALPAAYQQAYGENLLDQLPHLAYDLTPRSPLIRHRYRNTLGRMWHSAFAKPMADWCQQHNMAWTGHASPEEDPVLMPLHIPGWARVTAEMHWPGCDQISSLFPCPMHPQMLLGPKFAASLAHQHNRPHTMVETLGVAGENLTIDRMHRVITSLAVCGTDLIVVHGQMMSMLGHRKREAPPSIFHQAPYWPHFHQLSNYITRICKWMRSGKPHRPIAVLFPTAAFEALMPVRSDEAVQLARHYTQLLDQLMNAGLDFDIVADHDLSPQHTRNSQTAGFAVNAAHYQTLIIPDVPFTDEAAAAALDALCAADVPVHCLAQNIELLESQTQRTCPGTHHPSIHSLVGTLIKTHRTWLNVAPDRPVYVHSRIIDNHRESLILNPSDQPLDLQLTDTPVKGWTPGNVPPAPLPENADSQNSLRLHPWQSVVVSQNPDAASLPAQPPLADVQAARLHDWRLCPEKPNMLVLQRWDVISQLGQATPITIPARTDDWNRPDVARGRMQCRFICEMPIDDAELRFEPTAFRQPFTLTLNGQTIAAQPDADGNLCAKVGHLLQVGFNTLQLDTDPVPPGEMTILDPPRLEGTFRVTRLAPPVDHNLPVQTRHGWHGRLQSDEHQLDAITPAQFPLQLDQPADWTTLGFPHYSGGMQYQATLDIQPVGRNLFVQLTGPHCDAVQVTVNDQAVGTRCWAPWQFDITPAVQPGKNIVRFNLGNTRINIDEGLAQPSGLLGPVLVVAETGPDRGHAPPPR